MTPPEAGSLAVAKGQALGNDYLVVDAADLAVSLPGEGTMTPALARAMCDRHTGLGSDGVLVGWTDRDPIRLRIWNPDGTGAEKSGNGLRIFGAWLHRRGLVDERPFAVELPRDTVRMEVLGPAPAGALDLRVAMGRADFNGAAVAFRPGTGPADDPTDDVPLDLGAAGSALVNTVSLGNPHCVVLVEEFDRADFEQRGPALATHGAFAEGTNVQFARPAGRHAVEAWIWERGAGETLASGSSASAVAATLVRKGLVDAGPVLVRMPGGDVTVDVGEEFALTLRGPAQIVYEAVVPAAVLSGWVG